MPSLRHLKMANTLLQTLQNPAIYPHPVSGFEVIETHLSWILLTGDFAYKIKKPLNLGFQDFTTLEKRKRYCELEVILNKRLAPSVYIKALPIRGTVDAPSLEGKGNVIEYAVKMNQFEQAYLLSNLISQNKITPTIIKEIAAQSAQFHLNAQVCDPASDFGTPDSVNAPIIDNFIALKSLPASRDYLNEITQIEQSSTQQFQSLKSLLAYRKAHGFIRATHGDFHLGNMVLINQHPVIFDCIEFNESFRWTDVMNDVCFLAMDLDHHHLNALSHLFVNDYLEQTFDYEGAQLLLFYKSYRAMVRAKISALQLNQVEPQSEFAQKLKLDLRHFLSLGLDYIKNPQPTLCITHGFSGSGKSLYTSHLMMQTGAIRLRADVFRKHLHKLNVLEPTPENVKEMLYSEQTTRKVYEALHDTAKMLLQAGRSVIIDATCLKQWQRSLFSQLANNLSLAFTIYAFEAPPEKLQARLGLRATFKDPSDADEQVLLKQQQSFDALTEDEKSKTVIIDAAQIDGLIEKYLQDQ